MIHFAGCKAGLLACTRPFSLASAYLAAAGTVALCVTLSFRHGLSLSFCLRQGCGGEPRVSGKNGCQSATLLLSIADSVTFANVCYPCQPSIFWHRVRIYITAQGSLCNCARIQGAMVWHHELGFCAHCCILL